ncbi:MAG: hypothetical protein WB791_01835 [Waddliaceae bacterium]
MIGRSNDEISGPWGNQQTLDNCQEIIGSLLTPKQKNILPMVNPLDPKGRIWMGSYPGDRNQSVAMAKLDVLVNELEIKTFLCLQEQHELDGLLSYLELSKTVAERADQTLPGFLHFPIADFSIAEDEKLLSFLNDMLIPQIEQGSLLPLYIHCRGGNGRTGTVAALLLSYLYGLDGKEALEKVSRYHRLRETPVDTAPETDQQEEQVIRLAPKLNPESKQRKRLFDRFK